MHIVFLNIYPRGSIARYLLSAYVLRAYLGEHLGPKGQFRTTVINVGEKAPIDRVVGKVTAADPDVICYSCYLWNIAKVEQAISRLTRKTKAWHVLGGPEISSTSITRLAELGIGDFFIVGEGEEPLKCLIEDLFHKSNSKVRPTPGVVSIFGKEIVNGPPALPLTLAKLPSVYLSGSIEPVYYSGQQAYLETQRGCRNKCAYCVYHKSLAQIKYFPIERIQKELDHLILEHHVKALRIFDAVFTSDLDRAKALVRHLIDIKKKIDSNGHKLPWIYWEFIYSQVDDEFLELTSRLKYKDKVCNSSTIEEKDLPQLYTDFLKDYTVINCIGVQSFNKESLRAVQRPSISSNRFETFIKMVRKYNIVLKVDLIFGLPFETIDSFWHGVERLLPLFVDSDHILNIHRLQMLPGSDLEQNAEKLGLTWDQKKGHLVRSTTTMSNTEIRHGSLMIAMLFRLINSPLRPAFFKAHAESELSAREICETMLKAVRLDPVIARSQIATAAEVDDIYWNDSVFHEIPSVWAKHQLGNIHKVLQ